VNSLGPLDSPCISGGASLPGVLNTSVASLRPPRFMNACSEVLEGTFVTFGGENGPGSGAGAEGGLTGKDSGGSGGLGVAPVVGLNEADGGALVSSRLVPSFAPLAESLPKICVKVPCASWRSGSAGGILNSPIPEPVPFPNTLVKSPGVSRGALRSAASESTMGLSDSAGRSKGPWKKLVNSPPSPLGGSVFLSFAIEFLPSDKSESNVPPNIVDGAGAGLFSAGRS